MQDIDEQRFNQMRDIVYLFANTTLFIVKDTLIPNDYIDRTLAPEAVSLSYDQVLLGGVLFDCPDDTICEIITPFRIRFSALKLKQGNGYGVMGPYLADLEEGDLTLDELLLQNQVPISERDAYRLYLDRLPVVSHGKIMALMGGLYFILYNQKPKRELNLISLTPQNPAPCPVFEEDAIQARADTIRQRYEREGKFMEAVARGDDTALLVQGRFTLDRLPNRLRNQKNLMIVLNTLLRKSVEQAKVHPLYIDAISGKWAVRIENAQSVGQLDDYHHQMVLEYCALTRKHSLAHFSPNVRAAIDCIHFNLSLPELSLKFIAKHINVNASYLSHQFNQEAGMSIPEYVSRLRVEMAQNLLRSARDYPVGQVAAAVGMQDVNYFSKVFKRIVGCTPTIYRKRGRSVI